MNEILSVLLVEDSGDDAKHLSRELEKGGINAYLHRVETRDELVSALERREWDIVLSDYSLAEFSGMSALELVKERKTGLPFIMISESLEEEVIVEALKAGADDYIRKDRPFRLCPAVNRALQSRKVDIEMEKLEIELKEAASHYHMLGENINDVIWTLDRDRKITFITPSVTRVLGYRVDETLGEKLESFLYPQDARSVAEAMRRAAVQIEKHEKSPDLVEDLFEMEVRHKSGRPVWLETKVVILKDANGSLFGILGASRDITRRKGQEKDIDLFIHLFQQIDEGVAVTDKRGIVKYVNESFKKHSSFQFKKFIGESILKLGSRSTGNHLPQDFQSALRKGRRWKGKIRTKNRDGISFQMEVSLYPMRDKNGKATNFILVARDVTEELKIQKKFVAMQKMEALGKLAGGIAHDFNNILMPIIVNTEMLLWDSSDKNDPQNVCLNQILDAAIRGKELVKQIVSFSRKGSVEKEQFDLFPLIKESLRFLASSSASSIKIESDINIDEGWIEGNPTQIHQVLMNLFTNAADAVGVQGGRIKVTLDRTEFESEEILQDSGLKAGPYVRLSVSDSGPGIEPDNMDKIFEPFFSSKDPGEGSGMGLTVAHGIVYNHGGTINVVSEPKKGATFHVYLPLFVGRIPSEEEKMDSLVGGRENILLVDDDASTVESVQKLLRRMGYNVTGVTSSREALSIFKSRPDSVDLVITDQIMPGLTGIALSKEMSRIQKDVPLILMTGFSETISTKELENLGIKAFLLKPLDTKTLATTIRRILDRRS